MDDKKRRGFSTISIKKTSRKCQQNKKGQVTIFIIIGIIILFVFAGVLYFTKYTVTDQTTVEGTPIVSSVPAEFQPLQTYTENCVRNTAKQGLKLLGQQGGYIYPELSGKFTLTPTEADGIFLGSLSVPYWHYKKNPSSDQENIYTSLQPKLHLSEDASFSVEAQLNRFIREKIGSCLNEYQPFVQQGFVVNVETGKDKVTSTIGDSSVNVLFEQPITAKKGSAEKELKQFYVQIPLQLKHYFDLAVQLTKTEQEVRFLERQGMELVSIYSRKDSRYLAPISLDGYDLVSSVVWSEADLKQKYSEILASHVPMLQFMGSANFYYAPINGILTQKATDNAVLTLTGAEDVDVTFNFVPSEIYFKTNSQNGVIAPNSVLVHASVLTFGFQEFDTHYDISYPVMISLRDANALDGEDYVFNFALEANIRNNEPAAAGKPEVERSPVALSSIACNPEQRDTGLLKTIVVDSYTKEPLDAVRIGFTIPNQADCEMGLTDKEGQLEEKYPTVYGGIVSYLKKDYLTNFYPIDTYKLKNKDAIIGYAIADVAGLSAAPAVTPAAQKVVEMDRIKTLSINVLKKNVEKCLAPLACEYTAGTHALLVPYTDISCSKGRTQCFFPSGGSVFGPSAPLMELEAEGSLSRYNSYYLTSTTSPLAEDEEALVVLDRVKGLHNEVVSDPFSASAIIKESKDSSPAVIQLVPGIYSVSVQVIQKSRLTIPADERCFAYDILTVTKKECSDLSSTTLNNYIGGGLEWNQSNLYLTITPEQLYPSSLLTFTVPVQNLQNIPDRVNAPQKECGGFLCAGGKCLFQACAEKNVAVSGKIVEDLQVPAEITKKTSTPEYRALLKPTFKS